MKVTEITLPKHKPQVEQNLIEYVEKKYPINKAMHTMMYIPVKCCNGYLNLRTPATDQFVREHSDGTDKVYRILKIRDYFKLDIPLDHITMTTYTTGLLHVALLASQKIWGYHSDIVIGVDMDINHLYRLNLESIIDYKLDEVFGYPVEDCIYEEPHVLQQYSFMLHIIEILFFNNVKLDIDLLRDIFFNVPSLIDFRDNLRLSKDIQFYINLGLTAQELYNILKEDEKVKPTKPEYIYELIS